MSCRYPIPTLASIRKCIAEKAAQPPCPNLANHDEAPNEWEAEEWCMARLADGWTQSKCPDCIRWSIWEKR